MGLFRLLFILAIVAGGVWLWRRMSQPKKPRPTRQTKPRAPAPMVRCEHCGVHIPRDHALARNEKWFCSQTHLELGPNASGH